MKSHGTGLGPWEFAQVGVDCVFETAALIFHPENIFLGDRVYVGHQAILRLTIKIPNSWLRDMDWATMLHSFGGIETGENVGIGPGVKILTSQHELLNPNVPIMHQQIEFAPVRIGKGCDVGANGDFSRGDFGRFLSSWGRCSCDEVISRSIDSHRRSCFITT